MPLFKYHIAWDENDVSVIARFCNLTLLKRYDFRSFRGDLGIIIDSMAAQLSYSREVCCNKCMRCTPVRSYDTYFSMMQEKVM
jgi:hypothetical protein